ncbi:hypothetical protein Glove_475g24 [Diversispora epigaea]|uniref:Uncharacterized protein n=1 Tax=Diversispora epigaea TaxID=1348612 RepID=A0A397GUH4_9GLOM|nr:hypothetical protein Glove_475g28 [Diversispora epigaea]RHZ51710.1 hypothetical protein Glove_475g24 [Diversispora epigaea]
MISELNDLSIHGLKDLTGKVWTIILYFNSDWKFLAIILDFNSANSKYFYQIKTAFLNNEKPPPGHIKPPLLSMISLDHYIPDELHIITKIIDEMCRISVIFYFWQEQGTQNWEFTSLMGGDKEIVLKDFNFEIIFDKERASKQWLNLFLTPLQGVPNTVNFKMGLYRPTDVTPYMHILVNYLSEFMERHRFSLNGGKKLERKSAIFEILDYENRALYFSQKNIATKYPKPQRINIKKLKR